MSGIFDIEAAARRARLDEFAKAALVAILPISIQDRDPYAVAAEDCYDVAEAMLAESEKRAREVQEKP